MDQGADRCGAGHGVGQPDVQRDLGALAGGGQQEQQADDGRHARSQVARAGEDVLVGERAQGGPQGDHGQNHAEVAHPVDQKGLLARVRVVAVGVIPPVEPEANEQVRCQAHAFPAHEHAQEVIAEHQDEHGEDEEIQVNEEALVALILVHVLGGIDVDQRTHARDH